jgi:hypothetical protein
MRRVVRSPIAHCIVLGAVLFAGTHLWRVGAESPPADPIVISAADAASPRRVERIEDALLLRAALASGFDRQDGAVRERLLRVARYLGVASEGDADSIEAQARALGLEHSDLALRRHLVEMMRLVAARTGPADLPSDDELRTYYAETAPRFTPPLALRLRHIYLSRARRGVAAERDAETILRQLHNGSDDDAVAVGDPFARGEHIGPVSAQRLDAIFGPGFAAAVTPLPVGAWAGPVRSSYGVHLVRVEEIIPGMPPPFELVRSRVLHEFLRARGQQHLAETLRALRAHYPIRVAATDR